MRKLIAALCLALCASPAVAEGYFQADLAQWHVFGTGKKCTAINRPPIEFNMAPFNALQIRLDSARQYELSVMFWPGSVPETTSKIALTADPDDTIRPAASLKIEGLDMVTVTEPLPKEFVRRLESGPRLTILWAEVPDSKAKTAFDISDMPQVLSKLQDCAGVMERSK